MSNVGRCVGAKANVLHCVGFERGDAALLILLKRWHFVFHFSVRLMLALSSFRVRHNGYVYETFGISKHFPVKLQVLLIRAETFDISLTAKCFIYDVMRLPFLFSIILFVKFVHYFNVFVRKFVNYKVHYFCWNLFVKCRSNSTCYASNS